MANYIKPRTFSPKEFLHSKLLPISYIFQKYQPHHFPANPFPLKLPALDEIGSKTVHQGPPIAQMCNKSDLIIAHLCND